MEKIDLNLLRIQEVSGKNCYFLAFGKHGIFDKNISKLINMHTKRYKNILVKQFNADRSIGELYFNTKKDAENALEWIKSIILMNELKG